MDPSLPHKKTNKKKLLLLLVPEKTKRDTLRFTVGTTHFRGFSVEPVEKAVKTNTSVAYWKLYVKHTADLIFSICIDCALVAETLFSPR